MAWLQESYRLNMTSENSTLGENGTFTDGTWFLLPEIIDKDPSSRDDPGLSSHARRPSPYGLQPGHDDPIVVLIQAISMQAQLYAMPTYCGVGLTGNLLAIGVLLNSELWNLSALRYLLALLSSDVMYLVILLISWLSDVQGVGVYSHGGLCHFTTFLSHGSCFLALWYLVCFAVDGYIRICFRRRQEAMCTTTRANVVILAFMAVAIAVFINISITFGVTAGPVLRCAPLKMFIVTLQTLFKIDIFLNSMLPDVVIIYLFCHALLACLCKSGSASRNTDSSRKCRGFSCCSYCCCHHPDGGNSRGPEIRLTQEHTHLSLEKDFQRLYFTYIFVSTCLNLSSHLPRIYFTIHGLLYPNRPLTMKHFVWQQLLIHAYYIRCTINFLILFCASKNFRGAIYATVTSLGGFLLRLRRRRNPSSHVESGNHVNGPDEDETVTALMKDTTACSTTPV